MSLGFSTTLRNNRLDEITALIDAGAGAGLLKIYTGPRPATGAAITSEILLATLTFSDPSFPAAAVGIITASAITSDSSADATGNAAWFRILDSDLNFVLDGSIGLSGSDLNVNQLVVVGGVIVGITDFQITDGNV